MKVYKVTFEIPGAGEYIPEDPCVSSGGYRSNKLVETVIPAISASMVKEYVKRGWPQAVKLKVVRLDG